MQVRPPEIRLYAGELIVDGFAGGGGTSEGLAEAFGRDPDYAFNHDDDALSMHAANHPNTEHICCDIREVDWRKVARGRRIGCFWISPDCKHHSKAKGGKPVDRKIRGLAWVAVKAAEQVRPRVIMLENVEEFSGWGPLGPDSLPDKMKKGFTFRRFVRRLQNLGYEVDWRELRCSDHGVPTTRKRLFLVARCDGLQIRFPDSTHGHAMLPMRTAAECIDFDLPCPSIFLSPAEAKILGVRRPLAENTMRRIARGVWKYVISAQRPFIVPVMHGPEARVWSIDEPHRTLTGAHRGDRALVMPYLVPRYGERAGQAPRALGIQNPMPAIVPTANGAQLVSAFLAKHYGDTGQRPGSAMHEPIDTITSSDHHALVASHLIKLKGTWRDGQALTEPLHTVQAGGNHYAQVQAFLIKFYGEGGQWQPLTDPMHTIRTKDCLGLVTVHGEAYQIVDIGMRMLTPRERFRAHGFREDYIIDRGHDGRVFTKEAQGKFVGNSVPPEMARRMAVAQFSEQFKEAAA